jgi:hypothetical protein
MAGSLELSIEVADRGRPLVGTVRAPEQPDRPFEGWTELFAALHAAIGPDPSEKPVPKARR